MTLGFALNKFSIEIKLLKMTFENFERNVRCFNMNIYSTFRWIINLNKKYNNFSYFR